MRFWNFLNFSQKYGMWPLILNVLIHANIISWKNQFTQNFIFSKMHFLKVSHCFSEVWHVTPHFECFYKYKHKIVSKKHLSRKDWRTFLNLFSTSFINNLVDIPSLQTLSNVFSMSMNTAISIGFSRASWMLSVSFSM